MKKTSIQLNRCLKISSRYFHTRVARSDRAVWLGGGEKLWWPSLQGRTEAWKWVARGWAMFKPRGSEVPPLPPFEKNCNDIQLFLTVWSFHELHRQFNWIDAWISSVYFHTEVARSDLPHLTSCGPQSHRNQASSASMILLSPKHQVNQQARDGELHVMEIAQVGLCWHTSRPCAGARKRLQLQKVFHQEFTKVTWRRSFDKREPDTFVFVVTKVDNQVMSIAKAPQLKCKYCSKQFQFIYYCTFLLCPQGNTCFWIQRNTKPRKHMRFGVHQHRTKSPTACGGFEAGIRVDKQLGEAINCNAISAWSAPASSSWPLRPASSLHPSHCSFHTP